MRKIICGVCVVFLIAFSRVHAATEEELRRSIEGRAQALQQVNEQIQETQKRLTETEERSRTLNREVRRSEYLVSQLNLTIKSGEIKIQKLGFEVEQLELEITKTEESVGRKRELIGAFIRELEERERENLLVTILKSHSFAESLRDTQSLTNLNEELSSEIEELKQLKKIIAAKLAEAGDKKRDVEGEQKNLRNRKSIAEEERQERQDLLKTTKNQERVYQQQIRELERKQEEIASEIEVIEQELRLKINRDLLPTIRIGVLGWPAKTTMLTQGYGNTAFALKSYRGGHHNGVDIGGPIGTEIYAAERGEVAAVDNQDRFCPRGAYGRYVVIRHANGLTTLYAHLSRQLVVAGQRVERGELIGYMGRTGYATGPHLHFTVWSAATFTMRPSRSCGPMPVGGDMDPAPYLERPPAA